jgi:hypothetical protein
MDPGASAGHQAYLQNAAHPMMASQFKTLAEPRRRKERRSR